MVMAQTALATDRFVSGTGTTYIDSSTNCDADVPNGPPASLNVDNGDNVIIYYNYSFDDLRRSPPPKPTATHDFVQVVGYDGWTVADGRRHYTDGMDTGAGSIQRTVYNVQESYQIYVMWYANITSDSCNDWDSAGGYIDLI